nr:immunoglobulin light chain junction region [Macaca mulatta]
DYYCAIWHNNAVLF